MYDKIAHQQFKLSLLIVEKKQHKSTKEHSYKNIGSGSQNVLTANETWLKTKQFPFNITHLIALIHSTQHFLRQANFAISGCKTKQFLLQTIVYKFFQEKAPVSSNFQVFKLKQLTAWAAPQTCDLSVPQNVSYPYFLSFLCALMIR